MFMMKTSVFICLEKARITLWAIEMSGMEEDRCIFIGWVRMRGEERTKDGEGTGRMGGSWMMNRMGGIWMG